MSKSRDLSLVSRDQQIIAMKREGHSYSEIAEKYGISKARISQIVSREYADVTDDSYREGMRLDLEGKASILNKLISGPGKLMVSPGGKIVCEYDEYGEIDYTKPVYDEFVKIDAIKTYIQLLERISRSHAMDRPKQREKDESAEYAQAMSWVNELAAKVKAQEAELERQRGDVVEAEIVDPPALP